MEQSVKINVRHILPNYQEILKYNVGNTHIHLCKHKKLKLEQKYKGLDNYMNERMIKVIQKITKSSSDIINRFGDIYFYFEDDYSSRRYAFNGEIFMNKIEISEETGAIHINIEKYLKVNASKQNIFKDIREFLFHQLLLKETRHYTSINHKLRRAVGRDKRVYNKIRNKIKFDFLNLRFEKRVKLAKHLRNAMFVLINNIHTEGIEEFAALESKLKFKWNHHTLAHYYHKAKRNIKKYVKYLDDSIDAFPSVVSTKKSRSFISLSKFFEGISIEDIGVHVVFTILYVYKDKLGQEPLTYLIKVKPYQFIKLYEDACHHLGFRPLVSITSGHGIYDYKTYVNKWSKTLEN